MKKIGNALAEFLHQQGLEMRVKEANALRLWPEVVGPVIANKTKPLRIEDGKLFVRVNDSTWRNELIYMERDLRSRLNEKIGMELVKEMRFR